MDVEAFLWIQKMAREPGLRRDVGPELDVVSSWFDRGFDQIGQAYGRQAVKTPCACSFSGVVLILCLAVPWIIKTGEKDHAGRGVRSPVNIGRGIAYRSDYGMWSPVSSPERERYDRVEDESLLTRKLYESSAAHIGSVIGGTKNPKIRTDLAAHCQVREFRLIDIRSPGTIDIRFAPSVQF